MVVLTLQHAVIEATDTAAGSDPLYEHVGGERVRIWQLALGRFGAGGLHDTRQRRR